MISRNGATIRRSGISQLLDSFAQKRIVFVSAPAGYGKTVALRQWLEGRKCAKALLPLDEYDNTVLSFCERFCAALCACQPQNGALLEIISRPAFSVAPGEFALRAIGTLSKRKRAVFVIDDLHYLEDNTIIELFFTLIYGLPKAIQLVLVSRNEPPAQLYGVWPEDSLAFVGAEHLRFSGDDIGRLYKKHGECLTPEENAKIMRFTGGWPIGVNALLLSGGKPSDHVLEYLDDFILPNIWRRLDENTREFMLCTAMARELLPPLCNALAHISDSEAVLHGLARAGAFVSPATDGAFEYHQLFRSFLRNKAQERGDAFLNALMEREGDWHLSENDFYSAAECYIRCKNTLGIVNCFDMLEHVDRGQFIIERMLPIIQSEFIQTVALHYPFLYYLMAWAAYAEGRDKDMALNMDSYYARYPEIAQRDPAHAHNILYMRVFDFRAPLIPFLEEAMRFPAISGVSGVRGSITMNMPVFHRGIRDFSELAEMDFESYLTGAGEQIGWLFGEEWGIISGCLIAGLLYERGQLDSAHAYAQDAVNGIREHFSSELKLCAMSILIYTLEALGRRDDAGKALQRLGEIIESDRTYYLNRNLKALIARHHMRLFGVIPAQAWIFGRTPVAHEGAHIHSIYEALTTARAYLIAGDYEQAIILLTKLIDLAGRFCRTLDTIEAQILLAASYWTSNPSFHAKAVSVLAEAIALARPYGFIQLFINEEALVSGILPCLQGGAHSADESAIAEFAAELCGRMSRKSYAARAVNEMGPIVAFTDRQKQVLALLCEGKSFQEIADKLHIKLSTVRSHIVLIYDKLNVSSKVDAISKIKRMGLTD